MDYKLVFLLPSRSRPIKFFSTIENIKENCVTENYEIICICEETDKTMNNEQVRLKISSYPKVTVNFTTTTGKINAINTGLKYLPEDYEILILVADDIVFTVKGFDSFIISDMQKYFPNLDGILHYPDNIPQAGERQITMPVMARKLVEYFGYIYNPAYQSVYPDTEQLAVVKQLNKHKFIPNYFYQHNHPCFGTAEWDNLYKYNESFYQSDAITYFKRLANNFDL
jgi:hypothetical protein